MADRRDGSSIASDWIRSHPWIVVSILMLGPTAIIVGWEEWQNHRPKPTISDYASHDIQLQNNYAPYDSLILRTNAQITLVCEEATGSFIGSYDALYENREFTILPSQLLVVPAKPLPDCDDGIPHIDDSTTYYHQPAPQE